MTLDNPQGVIPMDAPPQLRSQRTQLGAELRRLRKLAGVSGREIGRRTGMSQATVSRIELGTTAPALPQVDAWCSALDTDSRTRSRLRAEAELALNEVDPLSAVAASGLVPLQEDVRQLEATTNDLRNFQLSHVPGLLQTPEYAREVLGLSLPGLAADLDEAVALRVARQAVMADPRRHFGFVMTEGALTWQPASGPPGLLRGQLDRIVALAGLASIDVGIIPASAPMHALPRCPFVIYDDRDTGHQPFVILELPHAALYASDPGDVEIYRKQYDAMRRSAVTGREALALVRAIAQRLTDGSLRAG